MRYSVGDWVTQRVGPCKGIVKAVRGRNLTVLWLGRERGVAVDSSSVERHGKPRAFVLEGSLDEELESLRSAENVLRDWLGGIAVPLAHKQVHSLEDIDLLSRFLTLSPPPFVHISAHGVVGQGRGAYIDLVPGRLHDNRVYLLDPATISVFRERFAGMNVFFDTCQLGSDVGTLRRFVYLTGIAGVCGFRRTVYDSEASLFGLMLYTGVVVRGWTFKKSVERANLAMRNLGERVDLACVVG
jgi:hypothetical protein